MEPTTDWSGIIGSVVRFALGGIVGALSLKGVITKDQGEFLLASAAAGAVTIAGLVWIWIKTKAAQKLADAQIKIALEAPASTPVAVVKTQAAKGAA